jgi:haloalkane dehalogenase
MISSAEPDKKFIEINGKRMAYVEAGSGDPIIFQHGNPTSSYLWRNIIPHLADQGRCIAVDLIGMGDSDKLDTSGPDSYRYVEHREFLFAAWEALEVRDRVTFVIHDWGSALGFDWAWQHPDSVLGIAYMEAIVRPVTWDEWPEQAKQVFQGFRSEAGESMVLEKNIFVDRVLPASVLRELTDDEMAVYRRPYLEPGEDRRPTLTWPRAARCPRDCGRLFEVARRMRLAKVVRQRGPRLDPGRLAARVLPQLPKSDGGYRARTALYSGRLTRRDWQGNSRLASGNCLEQRIPGRFELHTTGQQNAAFN